MRIAMGCDHAGFPLKVELKAYLTEQGHEIVDVGTDSEEMVDYPQFCAAAARAVVEGRADRGIVLGGSGQGEQLAANKVRGVRAALCNDLHLAELSRRHNDSNILVLASGFTPPEAVVPILDAWLTSTFDGGRHARRVAEILEYERTHQHQ